MELELIDRKFGQSIELTLGDGTLISIPYDGDADLANGFRRLADEVEKHMSHAD